MTPTKTCFWCRGRFWRLTNDHVVPKAFGGGETGNIVRACQVCNGERGRLVALHLSRVRLSQVTDPAQMARGLRRAARGLQEALELQAKWVGIERERWGHSPSAELDLTLPDSPRRGRPRDEARASWRLALEEARRRAEARHASGGAT